jgi:ribonuclease HI
MRSNAQSTCSILSLNCAKSLASTAFALNYALKKSECIAICLQEPGLEKSGMPPSHSGFTCFTPCPKPKCAIYVKKIDTLETSEIMKYHSSFLGCRISFPSCDPIDLYCIYSSGGRDAAFADLIRTFQPSASCILIGDFNCHHPWWYGDFRSRNYGKKTRELSTNAAKIVDWLEGNQFRLHNKPGVPTHFPRSGQGENSTVIDLSFSRGLVSDFVVGWLVDHDSTSDHSIIGIQLNVPAYRSVKPNHRNMVRAWSRANWDSFNNIIKSKNIDFSNIGSKLESQTAVQTLYEILNEGIETSVPLVEFRPKFAPWWTKNLDWLTTRLKRSRKRLRKDESDRNLETFSSIKISWEKAVKSAKHKFWKLNLDSATNINIWKITKRHTQVHTHAVPDIDGAVSFEDKCAKFRSSMFPQSDLDLPEVPENFALSKANLSNDFTSVSRSEIKCALGRTNKASAVGSDKLNVSTLCHFDDASPSTLPQLATALFKYGCHYQAWKHALCVVIPKNGKASYSTAKSYRPISLLSCLGKVIEKVAANRIAAAGKICGAISSRQFGNREGHSAIDCLFQTLTKISTHLGPQSKRGYMYTIRPSLAAHDILGAFNNARPTILAQIMKQRKMPEYLINWVLDFLSDRTLSFSFDNCLEAAKEFLNAIPQGSPVSPILFSILISAILDYAHDHNLLSAIAYVDDITEPHADVNIGKVVPVLENSFKIKSEVAAMVGLSFAQEKSELIHFTTRARSKHFYTEYMSILQNGDLKIIEPSRQIKSLGVVVDETLSFIVHSQNAASKAVQSLGSLLFLRKGKLGISPKIARYLVISKIIPKMLWASPIWWSGSPSILSPLETAYNRLCRWITGLPPSTRTTKLLICAHMPPLNLWLDLISFNYAIRLITLPADHGLLPLPTFDSSRATRAGPHRILSFVKDYLSDTLESRSNTNPVNLECLNVHTRKPQTAVERDEEKLLHNNWTALLPTDSIVIYSDGSRLPDGQIGAGWAIYICQKAKLVLLNESSCYLGARMEVFDAELHAAYEALATAADLGLRAGHVYLCIDNQAAIYVLANNPDCIEGGYRACNEAKHLIQLGWIINTVWVPSHCGIEGNDNADRLAKKGATSALNQCPYSYTSVAWLKRKAKEVFLSKWRTAMGDTKITWKYPDERSNWSFRLAQAIFKVYCGRTSIDPLQTFEPSQCKCQAGELSSKHIIGHCELFENARGRLRGSEVTPAVFTNELVLDPTWGPRLVQFMSQTRLGFSAELNWDETTSLAHEQNSEESDFEVGFFE